MAIKISYVLSDEDFQTFKKQYEKNKSKFGDLTLEEFIKRSIDSAVKSHIQLTTMNEQMLDLFADLSSPILNPTENKVDINDLDKLINQIWDKNINNEKAKSTDEKKTSTDKKKLN